MKAIHPQLRDDLPGKIPKYIWRDGKQYFPMPELARLRGTSRQAASWWAHRHPEKTVQLGKHLYAETA
jgi:hypothetical protein